MTGRFENLNPRTIIETALKLSNRVSERFPNRGLARSAHDLASNARAAVTEAESLAKRSPDVAIYTSVFIAIAAGGLIFAYSAIKSRIDIAHGPAAYTLPEFVQGLDAAFNIVILTALGVAFIFSREARAKRRTALAGLSSLRLKAHVIDMHQLNKDPAAMTAGLRRTESSPDRDLTLPELLRYLDYCSEILSLISKLAALYAQYSPDPVVIDTVNDIEQLTSSLSNKIWQKIMIVHSSLNASGKVEA